jgi:hypothetical protein
MMYAADGGMCDEREIAGLSSWLPMRPGIRTQVRAPACFKVSICGGCNNRGTGVQDDVDVFVLSRAILLFGVTCQSHLLKDVCGRRPIILWGVHFGRPCTCLSPLLPCLTHGYER